MKKTQHGFTLIELMVTVAIVAILASIAYPSYRKQILKSHRADARSALLQVQVAEEKFFLQYNRYAGDSAGGATELNNAPSASPPGLGIASTTNNNYYTITLTRPTTTTYSVVATASGNQADDTDCKTLTITNTGLQSSTNSSNTASTGCWK